MMFEIFVLGSNCDCERIFSDMKNYWSNKKSNLSIGTLKAWLLVKNNLALDCKEFHQLISSKPNYLKKVRSLPIFTTNLFHIGFTIQFHTNLFRLINRLVPLKNMVSHKDLTQMQAKQTLDELNFIFTIIFFFKTLSVLPSLTYLQIFIYLC